MPYNLEQGLQTLKNTIKFKLRHRDYDRVRNISETYTKYVTGEDIECLLKRFTPREEETQFKQRVELTQIITSDIANRIAAPMYKIGRTRADISIGWNQSEKVEQRKKELIEISSNFFGDESVETYLTNRMVELDCTDPNSFIVVEFDGTVDPANPETKAKPYPFEVNSTEAVNYRYINNQLQFLIVLNEFDTKLEKYTLYLENEAIIAIELVPETVKDYVAQNPKAVLFYTNEEDKDKSRVFVLTTAEHKAGRIPARRVGTKKDLTTRGRTCVPIIHPAKPYFEKSIKTISEFDLTNCLHTFPQKIQYDEVCEGDIQEHIICQGGKTPEGGICKMCKGTGYKTHTSAADIVRVKMPKDIKDLAPLDNYMTYKNPPMELLEYQKKLGLYELTELAIKAVYTSELFTTDTVATTATEKNIDLESVYDTLTPFAQSLSSMWKHIMNTIASYRDLSKGIVLEHKFPKDFKMKPLNMLLEDLSKANTSGAPSYVKNEINKDITQKLYVDKPDELLKIEVKNKYFPFNGKSESEISNIIANDLASRYNKVLYANYDSIFNELEADQLPTNVSFYRLEPMKQLTLLKTKVMAFIEQIDAELSATRANAFDQTETSASGTDTQDFKVNNIVALKSDPLIHVTIVDANPGPNGGIYTIQLQNGTQKEVSGSDLTLYNA